MPETYPTEQELAAFAELYGFTIDGVAECPVQGVLIEFSRPVRDGEEFCGVPVAGPRAEHMVVENHYCPGDADEAVAAVTLGRACQRVMWAIESYGR